MGYIIEITGRFSCTPPLEPEHRRYINEFGEKRRMIRDSDLLVDIPDPVRHAVGLPTGEFGEFYTGSTEFAGQDRDNPSVLDSNRHPPGQPGFWCPWRSNDDGSEIVWAAEVSKYSEFEAWLQWLIENLFGPWGYKIGGEVEFDGEAPGDSGVVRVVNDKVVVIGDGRSGGEDILRDLETNLRAGRVEDRLNALERLNRLKSSPVLPLDKIPRLLKLVITDEEQKVRESAAQILEQVATELGPERLSRIGFEISEGFSDCSAKVRCACAAVAGKLGIRGVPHLPALKLLMDDEDEQVRLRTSAAVDRLVSTIEREAAPMFGGGNRDLVDEFRDSSFSGVLHMDFFINLPECSRYIDRCEELGLLIGMIELAEIVGEKHKSKTEMIIDDFPELPAAYDPGRWPQLVEQGAKAARDILAGGQVKSATHAQFYAYSAEMVTDGN